MVRRRFGRRLEQIAECCAGAEKPRANGVQRKLQEVGDFGVTQLFEFAQEQDFAVDCFELSDRATDPQTRLGGIPSGRIGGGVLLAEKSGAKSGFATMCAENLETNRVEIRAEERPGFVTGGGAEQGNESLLRQLLRLSGLGDTPSERNQKSVVCNARTVPRKRGRNPLKTPT